MTDAVPAIHFRKLSPNAGCFSSLDRLQPRIFWKGLAQRLGRRFTLETFPSRDQAPVDVRKRIFIRQTHIQV